MLAQVEGRDSGFELKPEYRQPHWYAAHTQPRHEKKVAEQFTQRNIESFLPLYPSLRRWKDRRVELELPLFPGYIFVYATLDRRLQILQLPSVVQLVGFGSLPTAIPDQEIEALRAGLSQGVKAEPHPYLKTGDRVLIKRGPFQDTVGVLLRKKDNLRVVLSVDLIMSSIAIEVGGDDIDTL